MVHVFTGVEVPGFEMHTEEVLGEKMTVFVDRFSSMVELLDSSLQFGDREYIVHGDVRLTFAEHHRRVRSVAAALAADFGVTKGDRVAIAAANRTEYVIAFWAATHLGAIAVTMNAWWSGPELRSALADCTPVVLIADAERISRIGDVDIPVIDMDRDFATLVAADPLTMPVVEIDEDDPAVILYTSGTTGKQKGATHSHRNLIGLIRIQQWITASRLPPGMSPPASRIFTTSPLFHVSGMHSGVVASACMGTTIVWPPGRFDPAETIRILVEEKCTRWSTVPTTVWRVIDHPDSLTADWSLLGHIGGGGMAWSPALQARMFEVFGDKLAPGIGYGLTESTAIATTASADVLRAHPDSVGPPLPTVEVDIRDGEIYIRGPLIMLGYWNQPEVTAATIVEGRWLRTGDLGHFEDGLLYLSSRRYDLILRGGENVYPAEIEGVLEGHPTVGECTVVGVDHPQLGQEVCAVVVPAPGVDLDTDALTAYVTEHLAKFKVPSKWVVVDGPLPRTETGKVVRAEVLASLPD